MKVQEMLRTVDFEDIWPEISNIIEANDKFDGNQDINTALEKASYKKAFDEMLSCSLNSDPSRRGIIVVEKYYEAVNIDAYDYDEKLESYEPNSEYNVSFFCYDDEECYGIEFQDWCITLGQEVSKKSIELFGNNFCAAHIVYEMTFCGMDRDSVVTHSEEMKQELNKVVEDIKNLIASTEENYKIVDFFDYIDDRPQAIKDLENKLSVLYNEKNNVLRESYKKSRFDECEALFRHKEGGLRE